MSPENLKLFQEWYSDAYKSIKTWEEANMELEVFGITPDTYFKASEFECAAPSCERRFMHCGFWFQLNILRDICGVPMVVTSAFRTHEYELSKNRSGRSTHCYGVAVDISTPNDKMRGAIIKHALLLDFSVGVYTNFIHLDLRQILNEEFPQVVFYGNS